MREHTPRLLIGSMFFGLSLTILMMVASYKYLADVKHDAFVHEMQLIDQNIARDLAQMRDVVRGLATALYAADEINSDVLRYNTEQFLADDSGVVSALFAMKVEDSARQRFEQAQQDAGFLDYSLHDKKNQRQHASPQRKAYFPVHLIEPYDVAHVPLLGLDLMSDPALQPVLLEAVDSGKDVSVVIGQGKETSHLWIFKAIYTGFSGVTDPYFINNRHNMVNGFVGIEVDLQKLLMSESISQGVDGLFTLAASVADESQGLPLLRFGQQQAVAWWSGFTLSKTYAYPLYSQQLIFQGSQAIHWFDKTFVLFFLSALVGLGFTLAQLLSLRALIKSEAKNRAVLDSAFEGVMSVNIWGQVVEVNPAAARIFTDIRQQCVGAALDQLIQIPTWDRQRYPRFDAFVRAHPLVLQELLEVRTVQGIKAKPADASLLEVSVSQTLLAQEDPLFTLFVRDVTEQRENRQKLARLAMVVEQSFNLIMLTDKQGVIQYVNAAFERVSGYTANELVGKTPRVLKSGTHSAQYYANMWEMIRGGHEWSGQFTNRNKKGELYYVEQTIVPIHEDGVFSGFASIQQDVTEKVQLQAASEHAQRLESLGLLAGGIAHDFNNLLTAILGHAGLAQRQMVKGSKQSQHLEHIVHASESAASLCRQMLAYSGKGSFVVKPLDLSVVVRGMSQLLATTVSKHIVMEQDLPQGLPLVEGDQGQLQQVVMNLMMNASEAIGESAGVITVQAYRAHLNQAALVGLLNNQGLVAGDYVALRVSDTGVGMDERVLDKMFDPFFTTKFTGRGLGMSAILGIVRGHEAGLRVTSVVGGGTVFELFFPMAEVQNKTAVEKACLPVITHRVGTVLVVDDEEMVRDFVVSLLEGEGLRVLTANDGVEGLTMLRQYQESIGVVLLDMTMPRMSGDLFYSEMRTFAQSMPVIVSSGYAEQDIKQRFGDDPLLSFIQKPYSPDTMIDRVMALLK